MGLLSDPVADGDGLERLRAGVTTIFEKGRTEGGPDVARNSGIFDLNVVGGHGIPALDCAVLDVHDGHLLAHHDGHDLLDIANGSNLPILSAESGRREGGQTLDHKKVLETLIHPPIVQLSIYGNFQLMVLDEPAMVLFQGHDSIFENAGRLDGLGGQLRGRQRQVGQ